MSTRNQNPDNKKKSRTMYLGQSKLRILKNWS
jgi:hypothetical protein